MKKYPISRIVVIVLLFAAFAYERFRRLPDDGVFSNIMMSILLFAVVVIGSGILAIIGGLVLHFSNKFTYWITNSEQKDKPEEEYDDVMPFAYAFWPVAFAAIYYIELTGKGIYIK